MQQDNYTEDLGDGLIFVATLAGNIMLDYRLVHIDDETDEQKVCQSWFIPFT